VSNNDLIAAIALIATRTREIGEQCIAAHETATGCLMNYRRGVVESWMHHAKHELVTSGEVDEATASAADRYIRIREPWCGEVTIERPSHRQDRVNGITITVCCVDPDD
jgi:hypothetical protein